MVQKLKAVLGIYPTRTGLEYAVEAFRDAGFRNTDISLVLPEQMSDEESPRREETNAEFTNRDDVEVTPFEGPLGWLDEVGLATLCGGGTFLVVGPIAQTLDDAASECAPMELATALISLGIPECETDEYAGKLMRGKALLSIHCDSAEEVEAARRLHADLGGMDVFSTCQVERAPGKFYRTMAHAAGK